MSESAEVKDTARGPDEETRRMEAVEDFEIKRLKYGFLLLVITIILVSVIFFGAAIMLGDKFDSPAAVLSLISSVTTLIGSLVGFYFGAQVGSSGYARAEAHRQETAKLAQQLTQQALNRVDRQESRNGVEG